MTQEPNTVHMRLYTPSGVPLNFVLSIRDGKLTETLPDVAAMEAMITASGYLVNAPGVEAGEVVEPILYVCRYDHIDKRDNREIPHIAFYSESEWLTKRWLHVYLDTPEEVEAFETATGLTVAKMPVWVGETHPERNNPKAQPFIVKLTKSIRIARNTYQTKEGETRHKLKRYVDTIGSSKPAPTQPGTPASGNAGEQGEPVIVWSQDEQVSFWKHWNGDKQIAKGVILDVLGVKALGEFKNSLDRANTLMEMETRPKASGQ